MMSKQKGISLFHVCTISVCLFDLRVEARKRKLTASFDKTLMRWRLKIRKKIVFSLLFFFPLIFLFPFSFFFKFQIRPSINLNVCHFVISPFHNGYLYQWSRVTNAGIYYANLRFLRDLVHWGGGSQQTLRQDLYFSFSKSFISIRFQVSL